MLILFHHVTHEIVFDIAEKNHAVDRYCICTATVLHFVSLDFHCFDSKVGYVPVFDSIPVNFSIWALTSKYYSQTLCPGKSL